MKLTSYLNSLLDPITTKLVPMFVWINCFLLKKLHFPQCASIKYIYQLVCRKYHYSQFGGLYFKSSLDAFPQWFLVCGFLPQKWLGEFPRFHYLTFSQYRMYVQLPNCKLDCEFYFISASNVNFFLRSTWFSLAWYRRERSGTFRLGFLTVRVEAITFSWWRGVWWWSSFPVPFCTYKI